MSQSAFQPLGFGSGTSIAGRYLVDKQLGSGAMSAVFLVADKALENSLIALKLFAPHLTHDQTQLQRFRQEVMISRRLTHPNIVRTYEFGETEQSYYYMTMEHIKGTSLDKLIEAGGASGLSFSEVVKILFDVAQGMDYAHNVGVVHRDLKPANILVSELGEIKIVDFGLAQVSETTNKRLTQTGECVGTPYYMAPEQVQEKETDHRMDIYALGIMAYELVTGNVPFRQQSWYDLAMDIVETPVPKFATKKNKIPEWFEDFVLKATAKNPDDRYNSTADIIELFQSKVSSIDALPCLVGSGRTTTRNQAYSKSVPRAHATLHQMAPFIFVASVILVVGIFLIVASDRAGDKVEQAATKTEKKAVLFGDNFSKTLNSVATSMKVLTEQAKEFQENQPAIDNYLKEKESNPEKKLESKEEK